MKSIPPPDPDPAKPAYLPPPGACDAHCHVFGPAAKYPYSPTRAYTPPDAPVEHLRRLHAHLGISRAVIVHASCHGTDMRVTLDAIASSNGSYRGVAMVGSGVTDAELERLHAGGIRGVRFNFVSHLGGAPDLALFDSMRSRVGDLGWHIVLHLDAEDIVTYADRIKRIPVPFVIDHMGRVKAERGLDQKPFKLLLALMRNELAWVKVCGAERVSSTGKPFRDAIRRDRGPVRGVLHRRERAQKDSGRQPDPALLGEVTGHSGTLLDRIMRISDRNRMIRIALEELANVVRGPCSAETIPRWYALVSGAGSMIIFDPEGNRLESKVIQHWDPLT